MQEGLEVTAFSVAKQWWIVKIFVAHHHLPLYYQFWWEGASAFQGPWWHRNCNKNARKKSPDCLASLELRVSSSALGVFFPLCLKNMQLTFPTASAQGSGGCASFCFLGAVDGERMLQKHPFSPWWNLRVKPRAVKETASCKVPVLFFIPSQTCSRKTKPTHRTKQNEATETKTDASWHFPTVQIFSVLLFGGSLKNCCCIGMWMYSALHICKCLQDLSFWNLST